jgi:hypothetical protein
MEEISSSISVSFIVSFPWTNREIDQIQPITPMRNRGVDQLHPK